MPSCELPEGGCACAATGPSFVDDLEDQRGAVAARVRCAGWPAEALCAFDAAAGAWEEIAAELCVAEVVRRLGRPWSPRLVRQVTLSDGTKAVLKVTGHGYDLGEGELLAAWGQLGVPCASPLDFGYRKDAGGAVVSHLLTEYLDGPTLAEEREAGADRFELIWEVAEVLNQAYKVPLQMQDAHRWISRWEDAICRSLDWLRGAGYDAPEHWVVRGRHLSASRMRVIHGDPSLANAIRVSGHPVLCDPAGATRGMREADFGRLCLEAGDGAGVRKAMAMLGDTCGDLDEGSLAYFVGIELVTRAGRALRAGEPQVVVEEHYRLAQELLER